MESTDMNIRFPESPFLLRCAESGRMGGTVEYDGGRIVDGGFIYLLGRPDIAEFAAREDAYRCRMMICMNEEWRSALLNRYPQMVRTVRRQMKAPDVLRVGGVPKLPDGFRLRMFGSDEFELHPFGHGAKYADYSDFLINGSGAVVYHDGDIVASCSTFISMDGEVEADISTKREYRRMGLAANCAAAMLRDCTFRGFRIHWDAQNEASTRLAERFGFTVEYAYEAFSFVEPETLDTNL